MIISLPMSLGNIYFSCVERNKKIIGLVYFNDIFYIHFRQWDRENKAITSAGEKNVIAIDKNGKKLWIIESPRLHDKEKRNGNSYSRIRMKDNSTLIADTWYGSSYEIDKLNGKIVGDVST